MIAFRDKIPKEGRGAQHSGRLPLSAQFCWVLRCEEKNANERRFLEQTLRYELARQYVWREVAWGGGRGLPVKECLDEERAEAARRECYETHVLKVREFHSIEYLEYLPGRGDALVKFMDDSFWSPEADIVVVKIPHQFKVSKQRDDWLSLFDKVARGRERASPGRSLSPKLRLFNLALFRLMNGGEAECSGWHAARDFLMRYDSEQASRLRSIAGVEERCASVESELGPSLIRGVHPECHVPQ